MPAIESGYKSATTLLATHNIALQMGGDHIRNVRFGAPRGACCGAHTMEPVMNEPGLVTISMNELQRVKIIEAVVEGRLSGVRAAAQLGLSERQVSRLRRRFEASGAAGL